MRKQSKVRPPTFLMGVVVGAIVAIVTLCATAALAGTGVGGVFNLGRANVVNATTRLSGDSAGRQLQVSNSSTKKGAAGIGIDVAKGKPPLVVNSSTKVSNLNADYLDGLHSSALQHRVTASCPAASGIRMVNANGSVTCSLAVPLPDLKQVAELNWYAGVYKGGSYGFNGPFGIAFDGSAHLGDQSGRQLGDRDQRQQRRPCAHRLQGLLRIQWAFRGRL